MEPQKFEMSDNKKFEIIRGRGIELPFKAEGLFHCEIIRAGKVIETIKGHNSFTTEGKNRLWDTMFGKGTPVAQIDPWYIGLVDNTPSPVFNIADTLASHSGWVEVTAYSGNRKVWDDADTASGSKGTANGSEFTMNATKTVNGIFICSVSSGTSGVLWSTGSFDLPASLNNGDILKVFYGIVS